MARRDVPIFVEVGEEFQQGTRGVVLYRGIGMASPNKICAKMERRRITVAHRLFAEICLDWFAIRMQLVFPT